MHLVNFYIVIFQVADILDVALSSVKSDDLTNGGRVFKDLYDGVTMTRTVMKKTFEKHGLTQVSFVSFHLVRP